MTAGARARLVRLAACGLVLLLAGWATSQALAEEVPVPTVPAPTTVAPDPPPPPAGSLPKPDPAPVPRPRATPKPAPAPAPRASTRPRVSTRPNVAPRPAARTTPAAPVAKPKPKAKPKPAPEPVPTVAQVERPTPALTPPVVTVEPVRSEDALITANELFASGIAFLAGLLIPIALVTAVVLARRRRPRASTEEPVFRQLLTPAPRSPSNVPAIQHPDILLGPPPSFVETEHRPPLVDREQPPPVDREEAPVTEPMEVAAAEWAGWEFCEIDWWRGYVKSHFFAKATTPGDADYVLRESPMFRWRGNGIPEATPETIAAHKQLLERLRAEGWEDDPGTPSAWYAQTFRRWQEPDALTR